MVGRLCNVWCGLVALFLCSTPLFENCAFAGAFCAEILEEAAGPAVSAIIEDSQDKVGLDFVRTGNGTLIDRPGERELLEVAFGNMMAAQTMGLQPQQSQALGYTIYGPLAIGDYLEGLITEVSIATLTTPLVGSWLDRLPVRPAVDLIGAAVGAIVAITASSSLEACGVLSADSARTVLELGAGSALTYFGLRTLLSFHCWREETRKANWELRDFNSRVFASLVGEVEIGPGEMWRYHLRQESPGGSSDTFEMFFEWPPHGQPELHVRMAHLNEGDEAWKMPDFLP